MTDYRTFKAEDLLQDDYFIHSMQYPTAETKRFWEGLIASDAVSKKEFDYAAYFLSTIAVEKQRMSDPETRQLHSLIKAELLKQQAKSRKLLFFRVAAAVLILLTGSASLYYYMWREQPDPLMIVGAQNLKPTSEYVELVLSDQKQIAIQEEKVAIDYGQKGAIKINEKVIEQPELTKKEKKTPQFNQLIVPFGKRSSITLEDGTHVWVNAGSRITYPSEFEADKREIYVDGEVYLDVEKDSDRPFHVRTADMDIVVLGTSFNVTAYASDQTQSVVLVNGSVQVKSKTSKQPRLLSPNEMLTQQSDQITVKPVDASIFASWINGIYMCDNEALESILRRLSRFYNIPITVDKQAAKLPFSGKLDLKEDIHEVLTVLASTAPVTFEKTDDSTIEKYSFMLNSK